jgi:hypothetical protein
LARIHSIGAIGEGVTHIFQRSGWRKKFWFKHDFLVLISGQNHRTGCDGFKAQF